MKQSTGVVQLIPQAVNNLGEKARKEKEFRDKLLDAFCSANIPIHKLLNPTLRSFIQWLAKTPTLDVTVPHPRTLRRNLEAKFNAKINEIKERVNGHDVYFMIDETPDSESRNVVNVMVGLLNGEETKSMLINVSFPEKCNNKTIQEIIMETCGILWSGNIYPHLKLIISDQAAYMLLAVRQLKKSVSFPNLKHVTCVIHALHLVCNSIMNKYSLVNRFFSKEKKFFKFSGKKKRLFKSSTGLRIIPFPILIRWGSWLKCVNYHLENRNFESIKKFFLETVPAHKIPVTEDLSMIQQILKGSKLEDNLLELSKYSALPGLMTKLEKQSLPLADQKGILGQVKDILNGSIHGGVLINSLEKNPDLKLVTGNSQSLPDRRNFKFCPLVNCDLERSFSVYRDLLTDKRKNLTQSSLKHLMVIKCNQNV